MFIRRKFRKTRKCAANSRCRSEWLLPPSVLKCPSGNIFLGNPTSMENEPRYWSRWQCLIERWPCKYHNVNCERSYLQDLFAMNVEVHLKKVAFRCRRSSVRHHKKLNRTWDRTSAWFCKILKRCRHLPRVIIEAARQCLELFLGHTRLFGWPFCQAQTLKCSLVA